MITDYNDSNQSAVQGKVYSKFKEWMTKEYGVDALNKCFKSLPDTDVSPEVLVNRFSILLCKELQNEYKELHRLVEESYLKVQESNKSLEDTLYFKLRLTKVKDRDDD